MQTIDNENIPKIVKKEYREKTIDHDIIRFSNDFLNDFILDESNPLRNQITINGFKIIFNIIQTIRDQQFMRNNDVQLRLFDDEFLTEHNTYGKIKIKNSKITRNTQELEKAYEFLVLYKFGWYKSKNAKGKTIKTLGGLISNVTYDERGYTSFLVSSYWLQKLLNLSDGFNKILHTLPYKTKSSKTILFCLWVARLKEDSGTVTLQRMNELFNTEYKTANEFCQKFMKPIKDFLDKNSSQSFGFRAEGDKILYTRYELKTIQAEVIEATREKQLEWYKISYYKKRHKLTESQTTRLKEAVKLDKKALEWFHMAYENMKKECEQRMIDYTGEAFMEVFQEYIVKVYEGSRQGKIFPKGYPKIGE